MSFSTIESVQRRLSGHFLARPCLLLVVVSCAWMVVGPSQEAQAQERTACADTLATAETVYRNRNYEKATSLAAQCTELEAVADTTAIRAHRVITLASLRQGDLAQARSAVRSILRIDPEYRADPVNDPPSYSLLVSKVRDRVEIADAGQGEAETPAEDPAEAPAEEDEAAPPEPEPSRSQPARVGRSTGGWFIKPFGIGFSDYTGDMPAQNSGHPFDLQEFKTGSGFPFTLSSEVGYQFSPRWALLVGMQVGNYPIIGYNTGDGSISDSWRYTPQLLLRHAFGPLGEAVVFYLDGGVNATFGGQGRAKAGYGPVLGGGVDIPISSSLSFYVESRFNFTLPDDAIDGSVASEFEEATDAFENVRGSSTGSFDSVNQLLGVGLRIRFGGSSGPPPPGGLPTQE